MGPGGRRAIGDAPFGSRPMTRAALESWLLRVSVLATAIAITVVPVISKAQVATGLGIAFIIGALATVGVCRRLEWRAGLPAAALFAGLFAWMALGLNWAADPALSGDKLGRVLPILVLGPLMVIVLRYAGRTDGVWLARTLMGCLVAGLAWILVGDLIAALGVSDGWSAVVFPAGVAANAGLTTLAIVIWLLPMTTDPAGRPLGVVAGASAAAVVLLIGQSDAALLAFATGGIVFLTGLWRRRFGSVAMVIVVVVSAVGPVVIAPVAYDRLWDSIDWLPASWQHRVEIWDAAVDHAVARPIGGSGINSFRVLEHDQPSRVDEGPRGRAVHPHNASLQIWVETGLVGVALLTALLVWAIRYVLTWPERHRVAAQAGIASASVILGLSYGAWQGWWLCLLFAVSGYAVGLAARGRGSDQPTTPRGRW